MSNLEAFLKKSLKLTRFFPSAVIATACLASCASIGMPGGGPKDEDPPRFVGSSPMPDATGVNQTRIVIEFDELINIKDAFSKVVVSPPSKSTPRVSAQGRRAIVQFTDSLLSDATYTIDFGNSIEDINESNKLTGFTFQFATGEVLDSLRISGIVLDASNLEPQQGMLVGVHSVGKDSVFPDSVFRTKAFERMARTDDRGRFTVRGLKAGKYRIFALNDLNNDYKWDNPSEDIAFADTDLIPVTEFLTVSDTIYDFKNSRIDTIVERQRTRFLPNDILLQSFNINYKPQYLLNYERIDSTRIKLIMNAPSDTLPSLSVVGAPRMHNWYSLERSQHNDTLTYWILPKSLITTDTLRIATTYLQPDSAQNIVWGTDTLRFITKKDKPRKTNKKKDTDTVAASPVLLLNMRTITSTQHEVYAPVIIETDEPIEKWKYNPLLLEIKNDTLWMPLAALNPQFTDSLQRRRISIDYRWDYGAEYRLSADSLAFEGIYGHKSGKFMHNFRIKNEDEYSSLTFILTGLTDSVPAFVELLSNSDKPLLKSIVVNGIAEFPYVTPGSYYARLTEDINGNGIFDTGSYNEKRQPEMVCYYPKKIVLKKNWDVEQPWDIWATAIDLQKPIAIKKNKPEDIQRGLRRNSPEDDENDDEYFDVNENPFDPASRRSNRNSGMPFGSSRDPLGGSNSLTR